MQVTKEIVPRQRKAPPVISNKNPFELLDFNRADNVLKDLIPRVKIEFLTAKDTPADFKKGLFTYNLGYQKEEVRVVLLAMKYGRILWDKYNPKVENPEPKCKSDNGEHSTVTTLFKEPQLCATCPHAQWSNGNPPSCSDLYTLLFWDLDDNLPFITSVRRTSIYPLRKLKTALKMTARKWVWPGAAPNASVSIMMKTKAIENYFIVDFPQRNLKGQHLWQRVPEDKALELTKVAIDLSRTFSELDLTETGDVQPEPQAGSAH